MAFSTEQSADLLTLQQLSTHFINILDKEATINADARQLTPTNIQKVNEVYLKLLDVVDGILESQITPP